MVTILIPDHESKMGYNNDINDWALPPRTKLSGSTIQKVHK